MRIIVYDNSGHPFQVQLSRSLSLIKYKVLHLFSSSFQTPKGSLQKKEADSDNFDVKGLTLARPFNKYSFVKRRHQEIEFGNLVVKEIKSFSPEVIILSNVPLDTIKVIYSFCKKKNIKLVFWVQDFYSIAIKGILRKKIPLLGNIIGQYYYNLERRLLKSSNHVVVIAKEFQTVLDSMSINNNKVSVIENWAPLEEMPVVKKSNNWAIENKLEDKFCFLYSGTLGLKHNPNLLLELALSFQNESCVRIVVVSEGLGAEWLRNKIHEYSLNNLIIRNFQPFEKLPEVLATGDVLVSILEKEAGIFSVPSKVLSYLCAQRALLLAVPLQNLSAKIVNNNRCGIVVSPDDVNSFVERAKELFNKDHLREEYSLNSRKYAEVTFNINSITNKFDKIIKEIGDVS